MPGKRTTDTRAHHGPEEDRARKPAEDRARGKLKVGRKPRPDEEGLTAKDQARIRRFRAS